MVVVPRSRCCAPWQRGTRKRVCFAEAEVAALPTLFELRAYSSLIHSIDRWRQQLSPRTAVTARAEAALWRMAWLRAHGTHLVDTVRAAAAHAID